uniref:Uncharacterized protein n=1 Tax=Arundo donax TaxID=35708 RepID=A0A0A9DTF4_ARUDO
MIDTCAQLFHARRNMMLNQFSKADATSIQVIIGLLFL